MKILNLTNEDFLKAPAKVQILCLTSDFKIPIGSKMLEEVIEENPEYFPDILEHRRRWETIPQEVHENYNKSEKEIYDLVFKDFPESKGIFGWIRDPEGFKTWCEEYEKRWSLMAPLLKDLHNKLYSRYGIEYKY
jgi:hypothetical protein